MPSPLTTAGRLLVDDALPAAFRDPQRVLTKSSLLALLRRLAQERPDEYARVSHELLQLGQHAAYTSGGQSFGLKHLSRAKAAEMTRQRLQGSIDQILDDDSLDDKQREQRILSLVGPEMAKQKAAVMAESLEENNPLAQQVRSGSRGNEMNLASLRAGDLLYQDHRERTIPIPVLRSYSEGLSPWEYWAGTYGARKGVIATKFATQQAGFLCLARGTEVRLASGGIAPIEEIAVGTLVLGADRTGHTFPVRVSAVFNNGVREVWRYRFRVGKSRAGFETIVATPEHRALAILKRGRPDTPHGDKNSILEPTELPLGRCGFGYRLVLSRSFNDAGYAQEPRAGLLGLLLAEGGLTGNNTNFSTADPAVVAAVERLVAPLGFSISQRRNKDYEFTIHDEQPLRRPAFGPIPKGLRRDRLRIWLSELGLLGKLAPDKFMPACVNSWDNASVAEMLALLFEGDGWITETNHGFIPVIGLGMTARPVVEAARDLLAWRFGVHSTPVVESERDGRNVFVLQISTRRSIARFAANIRMPGIKGEKLRELLPAAPPPTRADEEFLYSYVDKEYLGLLPTHDIEVDHPDHLFVLANGAIVSNSKQLNQINHRLLVTAHDEPEAEGGPRGLPVDVSDHDSVGSLLAAPAGRYPRNTVLTPKLLDELQAGGIQRILVRSPAVGGASDGGILARDAGVREFGRLPGIGENIGLAAAQALSEPISQGQLSAKHSGGVAGQEKAVSGFDYINQQVQIPKHFRGGAAHARVDGTVERIEEAPAGGYHVTIDSQPHYVAAGYPLKVQRGDRIEAGDVLSEGAPNPAEIVHYKGIGEGRRYFIGAFLQAMRDAGMRADRRNIELLSRGLINHVRLTDEFAGGIPDDVMPYSSLEHRWQPREGAAIVDPRQAVGRYLERPVLHHTIGTRVRPSMLKDFAHFGVKQVLVHPEPPPFEPEMQRGMSNLAHDPDWFTRMYGSGLKSSLQDAVHRGGVSDAAGTSFVPGLAKGVDFGHYGKVKTPKTEQTPAPKPNFGL